MPCDLRKRRNGVMGSCYYRPAERVAGVGGDQSVGTVKSKNRAGSGSSRAVKMAFCPGVVAERSAT